MSDNGNVPQETQANPAGNLVEAATTTAAPSSTETTGSQQLSVPAESSSEPGTQLAQPKEEVKVEEKPSTEAQPKEHLVSVEEAARLRRRAQQAEEQARQKEQEAANLRGQLEERARQTQQQKPASGYDGVGFGNGWQHGNAQLETGRLASCVAALHVGHGDPADSAISARLDRSSTIR